ncbi:hypothetical protein OWM07_09945 [Deferribacter thermophilus]|uniref:hypothetical protein n=1 Tax=Deferribacter thermophilus TaxID=53573 RepID=UPI003C2562EB
MRLYKLIFHIIFTFLILSSITFSYVIPNKVGNFVLITSTSGDEAKNEIYMLHRKHINIKEAYTLKYQSAKNEVAYIWLSKSYTADDAKNQITTMIDKLPKSKIYSTPKPLKIDNLKVYQTYGMDMDNYFYNYYKWNIWIAIKSNNGLDFLKNFIKSFHGRIINEN